LGVSPLLHCANLAALFTGLPQLGDAVRPGIALYGILPQGIDDHGGLEEVLSLHTQVIFLKDVPAGTPIGYGSRWTAHRQTRIATLPIGYNDGLPYHLGLHGNGQVLLRGRRCPVVGAVSMDYCTIDVTHVQDADIGDRVTFIGKDGLEILTAADVANDAETIPYEITCRLGSRVKRVYRDTQTNNPTPSQMHSET